MWIFNIPNGDEKWQEGNCTCHWYLKKYMCKVCTCLHCKHVDLAIRLKLPKPHAAAQDVPIGEKRSRSRIKKINKSTNNL